MPDEDDLADKYAARRRAADGGRAGLVRGLQLGPGRGGPVPAQPPLLDRRRLVGRRSRRALPRRRRAVVERQAPGGVRRADRRRPARPTPARCSTRDPPGRAGAARAAAAHGLPLDVLDAPGRDGSRSLADGWPRSGDRLVLTPRAAAGRRGGPRPPALTPRDPTHGRAPTPPSSSPRRRLRSAPPPGAYGVSPRRRTASTRHRHPVLDKSSWSPACCRSSSRSASAGSTSATQDRRVQLVVAAAASVSGPFIDGIIMLATDSKDANGYLLRTLAGDEVDELLDPAEQGRLEVVVGARPATGCAARPGRCRPGRRAASRGAGRCPSSTRPSAGRPARPRARAGRA